MKEKRLYEQRKIKEETSANPFQEDIEIERQFRGYNMEQVDRYTYELTKEYDRMHEAYNLLLNENKQLKNELIACQENTNSLAKLILENQKKQETVSETQNNTKSVVIKAPKTHKVKPKPSEKSTPLIPVKKQPKELSTYEESEWLKEVFQEIKSEFINNMNSKQGGGF